MTPRIASALSRSSSRSYSHEREALHNTDYERGIELLIVTYQKKSEN